MNKLMVPPQPGTQDGNWIWDGQRWVCDPDCGPPCPPPGSIIAPGHPPPFYPPPVTQPPWYPGANGGVSFSAPGQPPPNPIRGAFWFDGVQLWLFDGASWVGVGGATATSGGAGAATGTSPPSNPQTGALWFDGNALLVWDGTKWDLAGGGTATGGSAPSNPQPGALWFNGSVLYVWDGNAWIPASQTKSYIQPTAPPSPNPGDTWYDGQVQRIWDGHQWDLIGPGATVGNVPTTTLALSIVQSTAVAIPGGTSTWGIVPFTAMPVVDAWNNWDPVSKKYTPSKAGYYYWTAILYAGGTGTVGGAILKNDPGFFNDIQNENVVALDAVGGNSIGAWVTPSNICHMNGTTDYVRLYAINTFNGQFPGNGSNPNWGGWLLP